MHRNETMTVAGWVSATYFGCAIVSGLAGATGPFLIALCLSSLMAAIHYRICERRLMAGVYDVRGEANTSRSR